MRGNGEGRNNEGLISSEQLLFCLPIHIALQKKTENQFWIRIKPRPNFMPRDGFFILPAHEGTDVVSSYEMNKTGNAND